MANTFISTTFRIPGSAAVAQNLLTIENATGSAIVVRMRRLVMMMDATAVLTAVMPQFKCSRFAGAGTGGTAMTKSVFDSLATASNASVTVRGGASADGTASAITATPGVALWQQFGMRMHTVVGQVISGECDMLPALVADSALAPFTLRANESIVVHVVAAVLSSNPATNWYIVNAVWEEV
jgi:hypothetical protein